MNSITMQPYHQDLQLQTNYSDGRCSIDEIVRSSITNGRTVIGITDHAAGWIEGGKHFDFFTTGKKFEQYLKDIDQAKKKYLEQGVSVLKGLEVEIDTDGNMMLAKGILEVIGSEVELLHHIDYAIGVIHSECFADSLLSFGSKLSKQDELSLLLKNIAGLIANPRIRIWGHPFQVVHGHYRRNFTAKEQRAILSFLKKRPTPLQLEYNLNPSPHYEEWGGKSTFYDTGELTPNDLDFFEACLKELQSTFVVSTDAHDTAQTARLTASTSLPASIREHVAYLTA